MGGSKSHSNSVYYGYSSRMTLQYETFLVTEVTPVLGTGGFGCTGIIIVMFTVPIYIDIYIYIARPYLTKKHLITIFPIFFISVIPLLKSDWNTDIYMVAHEMSYH